MVKTRVLISFITIVIVGIVSWFIYLYARGYRFDQKTNHITPNGLLVIKSDPDGAQIYLNGELKTATNSTIPLAPGNYDVLIKKEGFLEWKKRLTIEKEIVTETTAHIFKGAPSLSAITFSGAFNPILSDDMSKIAFAVPVKKNDNQHNKDNAGLWIMETVNLPIGFSRDPRRITDGDLTNATWQWSPDGREVLLETAFGKYLLDSGNFTSQKQRVNITLEITDLLADWKKQRAQKLTSQLENLPEELKNILDRKTESIVFSPDKDMVLYTASGSASIRDGLIKPIPGASSQKQEREIKLDQTYVYDIKEDRNFLVDDHSQDLLIGPNQTKEFQRRMIWFPTSRHLVSTEQDKIVIMDYDGTNKQEVYKGSYISPYAYPNLSLSRLIVLTSLGANSSTANLYSLSIK